MMCQVERVTSGNNKAINKRSMLEDFELRQYVSILVLEGVDTWKETVTRIRTDGRSTKDTEFGISVKKIFTSVTKIADMGARPLLSISAATRALLMH